MTGRLSRRAFLATATALIVGLSLPRNTEAAEDRPAAIGDGANWELAFSEHFDSEKRFADAWTRVSSAGDGILSMRRPENVVLTSDGLNLELGQNAGSDRQRRPFTSGYVEASRFRQVYGYFECEMRIAAESGVNNAFWLVSDPLTQTTQHFELDVAEVQYPDEIQGTARQWRPERKSWSRKVIVPDRLAANFHRFGLLWSPQQFDFYFDDHQYFSAPNTMAHTPALVRFSNAVAAFAGHNDGDVVGAATMIRQLRIFQKPAWADAGAARRGHHDRD